MGNLGYTLTIGLAALLASFCYLTQFLDAAWRSQHRAELTALAFCIGLFICHQFLSWKPTPVDEAWYWQFVRVSFCLWLVLIVSIVALLGGLAVIALASEGVTGIMLGRVACFGLIAWGVIHSWSEYVTVPVSAHVADARVQADAEVQKETGKGRTLILLVHGAGGPQSLDALHAPIRHKYQGNPKIVSIEYLRRRTSSLHLLTGLSQHSPDKLCQQIESAIRVEVEQFCSEFENPRVVLIGHSIGALFLRKVFLLGCKSGDSGWTASVDRLVLMSSLNRGLDVTGEKPDGVSENYHFSTWLGIYVCDVLRVGKMLLSTEAGSQFVSNLRYDWVEYFKPTPQGTEPIDTALPHPERPVAGEAVTVPVVPPTKTKTPIYSQLGQLRSQFDRLRGPEQTLETHRPNEPTIDVEIAATEGIQAVPPAADDILQIVLVRGEIDQFVGASDAKDLAAARHSSLAAYHEVTVPGTGHSDLLDMSQVPPNPNWNDPNRLAGESMERIRDTRLVKFHEALTGTGESGVETSSKKSIVLVLHGIRDFGRWTSEFRRSLEKNKDVEVVTPRYGFFGMGPFLLGHAREKYVKWLMDEITQLKAQHPNAELDFFGHSNGTYLMARALEQYSSLRVRTLVFAGSVVTERFPWERYLPSQAGDLASSPRVRNLLNVTGDADWVVAFFPRRFQQVEWILNKSSRLIVQPIGDFVQRSFPGRTWIPKTRELTMDQPVGSAGFTGFSTTAPFDQFTLKGGHGAFQDFVPEIAEYIKQHRKSSLSTLKKKADSIGQVSASRVGTSSIPSGMWRLLWDFAGWLFVGAILVFVLLAGIWLIPPARQYATSIAFLYVLAIGWLLNRF